MSPHLITMTGLLSLPTELLQAIGEELGSARKQLRLVCAQLAVAMDPLVLSHVVIDITRATLSTSISQLQLLASPKHSRAHFIHELSIRPLAPVTQSIGAQMVFSGGHWRSFRKLDKGSEVQAGAGEMKEYLEDAIAKMVNLHVVRWKAAPEDAKWTHLAVINGLTRIQSLRYLNLHLSFGFDASNLRLDHLHGLRRIVVSGSCQFFHEHIVKRLEFCIAHSPEMSSIDIDRSHWYGDSELDIPSLHSLLGNAPLIPLKHLGLHSWYTRFDNITLPHLRFLKSLTFTNNCVPPSNDHPFSSTAEDIWSALRTNKIYLERLSTDAISASLIEYVGSYSGLTRIYLKNVTAVDQETSNQLAGLFFDSAVAQHSPTLEDLYVLPRYEGKWCFGEHIAPIISRCAKLQYLKLAVISSEVNPSADDDTIRLLIDTAARHLPSLRHLSITTANAESLRGFERADASRKHFSFATSQVAKAIVAYIPKCKYQMFLPAVTANLVKYTPHLSSDSEQEGIEAKARYRRVK